MPEVKINIINDKELLALFDELTPKVQNQVIMSGLRKAASIINEQAKRNFRAVQKNKSTTGYQDFNSMFKTKVMKDKVGVITGLQSYKEGYKYRWLDKGTEERQYKTKAGNIHKTGKIKATHFFTDAVESKMQEAQNNIQQAIENSMNKTVEKYNRKYKG